MNDELPEGWITTSTRELLTYVTSGSRGWAQYYSEQGALFLRITNLDHDTISIDLLAKKYVQPPASSEGTRTRVQVGDLLISITADVGMIGLVEQDMGEAYINQHIALARPVEGINRKYLAWFLASSDGQTQLRELQRGATKVGLGLNDIEAVTVPFPPFNEQQRIVAKTEMLFDKVGSSRQRLDRIPVIVQRFRQSILNAACSGQLTNDWREGEWSPDALPVGWHWTTLSDLLPPGGIFDGPFGSNLKSSDYADAGIRVIRLENIGHLRFISEKETYVNRAKYESLKKHTVREGDIVFSSFISEQIRVCVLPSLSTSAIAKADCFCIRPTAALVDRDYLALQLACKESYDRLREHVHGATRPRVNTSQLRTLSIRICPLPEQKEIVRRANALFAVADKITSRYERARRHVNKLTQSILAKAFRGELVMTEAELARHEGRDFESAAQMLDRITNATSKAVASQHVKRRTPNRSRSKALT